MDNAWALLRDIRTQTFTRDMRTSDVELRLTWDIAYHFMQTMIICVKILMENKSLENAQNSSSVELDAVAEESVNLPNDVFNVMFARDIITHCFLLRLDLHEMMLHGLCLGRL